MPAVTAEQTSRNALVILATIAGGGVLYVLADILTPLALAVFLALMIDGFARALQARLPGVSVRAAVSDSLEKSNTSSLSSRIRRSG